LWPPDCAEALVVSFEAAPDACPTEPVDTSADAESVFPTGPLPGADEERLLSKLKAANRTQTVSPTTRASRKVELPLRARSSVMFSQVGTWWSSASYVLSPPNACRMLVRQCERICTHQARITLYAITGYIINEPIQSLLREWK